MDIGAPPGPRTEEGPRVMQAFRLGYKFEVGRTGLLNTAITGDDSRALLALLSPSVTVRHDVQMS